MRYLAVATICLTAWVPLWAQESIGPNGPPQPATAELSLVTVSSEDAEAAAARRRQIDEIAQHIWQTKIDLDVVEMPLTEVVALIAEQLGREIYIDHRSLQDQGVNGDEPVTIRVGQLSAASVLHVVLREFDATYVLEPGRLSVIAERDTELAQYFHTMVYPMDDLLLDEVRSASRVALGQLVSLLAPEEWAELGGPGTIGFAGDNLVINHTWQLQSRVARLLEVLRQAKALPDEPYDTRSISLHPLGQQVDQLARKLRSTTVMAEFRQVPLGDVVQTLSERLDLHILIDHGALSDVGLSDSLPIDGAWHDQPISDVLDDIVRPYELVWTIRGDLIEITEPEALERYDYLDIRVYPIRDLIPVSQRQTSEIVLNPSLPSGGIDYVPPHPFYPQQLRLQTAAGELIQLFESHIRPESWWGLGGPGMAEAYKPADVIVVSQTTAVHRQIELFLYDLRQLGSAAARQAAEERLTSAMAEVLVQIYQVSQSEEGNLRFSQDELETIHKRITAQIEPDSWDGSYYYAEILGDKLIIRHRREVQRAVYQLLADLGVIDARRLGLGGTFCGGLITSEEYRAAQAAEAALKARQD